MTPILQALVVGCALAVFTIVLRRIRDRRLRERHALLWLIAGLVGVVVAIVPGALVSVASWIGVEVPANLVFFVSLAVLFGVSVQYGSELTRLEAQVRTLAERVALLEERERARGDVRPESSPE